MELKFKKLTSAAKLDYNGYKKIAKATWIDLIGHPTPTEYALVTGNYIPWKNAKEEECAQQPLLYVGPTNKWKMELNGHSEMKLQDYSYGTCKVTQKGANICVHLLPTKGKLTDKKLLRPVQKELKKFKPKVFLEVVSAFEEVANMEEQETKTTNNGMEVLAKKIACLATLHELVKEDYKSWVVDYKANMNASRYILTALEVLKPETEKNAARFFAEYKKLPQTEKVVYKELAKLAKNYSKIKPFVQRWCKDVDLRKKALVKRFDLEATFEGLKINKSEHDLVLIGQDKIEGIKALIEDLHAFEKEVQRLPAFLADFRDKMNDFIGRNLRLLRLSLERTADNLEDITIQPKIHEGHNYSLAKLKGELFDRPTAGKEPLIADNDVMQGALGDCYLMASLIGLAKKYPDIIRNAIKEKKVGNKVTYEVTLYFLDANDRKKLVPQKICIDNQFMVTNSGDSAYAAQGDQGELWPLVIEKAMAKALGSYGALAGGATETALRMLSGKFPIDKKIHEDQGPNAAKAPTTKEEIIEILKENKGKLITISFKTPKKNNLFLLKDVKESEGKTEEKYIDFNGNVIYCNHAYTVENIDYDKLDQAGDKEEVITLYNPHNVTGNDIEINRSKKFPRVSPLLLKHCAIKINAL